MTTAGEEEVKDDVQELDKLVEKLSLDPENEQIVSEIGGGRSFLSSNSPIPILLLDMQFCDLSMKAATMSSQSGGQTVPAAETQVITRTTK